ncbi:transposase IS116/IS110/IS902 family protein, partial [Candidatus Magnetobacterium bavaricum]
MALGRLRKKQSELRLSLDGQLSDRHRLLLKTIKGHVEWLHITIADTIAQVVAAMKPYLTQWKLLQTIPGVNEISAAMLLTEIGNCHECIWQAVKEYAHGQAYALAITKVQEK